MRLQNGCANLRACAFRARAYGLDIWSDLPLPEFLPSGGGVDVVVVLEKEEAEAGSAAINWNFSDSEAVCSFPGVARFRIRAGREIRVKPAPGADPNLLRLYVEGMMMAILLHQRNYFVLHASVVDLGGRSVAFLGHIGAGKSTTALALSSLGYRLIADDNAAISNVFGEYRVLPAFPRVKVYPAIARALGIPDEDLEPMHASQAKKTYLFNHNFPGDPVRLDRIYLLSIDAPKGIQRLPPAESLIEMIKNSVPTRWGLPGGPEQLKKSAALARSVPIYQVRTFQNLEEIGPLAQQIKAHIMDIPLTFGVSSHAR